MGIMVHSLLWVMQDLYHQPQFMPQRLIVANCATLIKARLA